MSFAASDIEINIKLAELCEHGDTSQLRYEQSGDVLDLVHAIRLRREAVNLIPDGHICKPSCLSSLGISLQSRFEQLGVLADIESAIVVHQQAVDQTLDSDADKPAWLNKLARALQSRFQRRGDLADIDDAILAQQQAINLTPDDHINKPFFLRDLGMLLENRFERLDDLEDIDNAILAKQRAVGLVPDDHALRPGFLVDLGVSLQIRFKRLGNLPDVDNAIMLEQQAVDLTPDDHAMKPTFLHNLSKSLGSRWERLGDLADIRRTIIVEQHALDLTTGDHAERPSSLNNLGVSFQRLFLRLGDLGDINKAIFMQRQAVDLASDSDPSKPALLNNLGLSLEIRFKRLGNLDDIDAAITVQQHAIDLTSNGHPDKPFWQTNLSISFLSRFERLGILADIDNAVAIGQEAVELMPDDHASKPSFLSNLGVALECRYERLDDLADLDYAITIQQQAIDLTPDDLPSKPIWLANLGSSLGTRFGRLGDLADLDKAIAVQQLAADLTPDDHSFKPSWLGNLGISLRKRFEWLDNAADIDSAIIVQQQAIDLIPGDHANKPTLLGILGSSLRSRFERLGDLADIDNAIILQQQAVDMTPDGHASKPSRLNRLGFSLQARFRCLSKPVDRIQLISTFRTSALCPSGEPSTRLEAALEWAAFLYPDLEPYHTIIALIPQEVWLGKNIEQRYYGLQTLGDAVFDAVSAACVAGNYDLALEWLEQGRAIIWGQILRLRSPMDDLRAAYPELAQQLSRIAGELEVAGSSKLGPDGTDQKLGPEQAGQRHRRLAEEWEELLKTVQALPNFTHFLSPKPSSVLKNASINSTIVIINVSDHQCDALILQSGSSSIGHVHLATLSLKKLEAAQERLSQSLHALGVRFRDAERGSSQAISKVKEVLPNVLKMLWIDVAKPILDYLEYTAPSLTECLPHITWCLTGPLAILPLHAAGVYDNPGGQERLFNYVVSSYTPSLTAFLEGLEKKPPRSRSLLAITQAETPKLSPLPGTIREVNQVHELIQSHQVQMTRIDGEQATVKVVSEAMNTHSWVHLSCHGMQNALEPTKSAFFLHDGPLELAEIMKKPLKNAELAYLSACQTATGDAKLPDEAVHLAAGMFTAGYRSVVATLWSIIDNDAPLVASVFYDRLLKHPERGVAFALHDAVAALRQKLGEDKLINWVPYIHIGH